MVSCPACGHQWDASPSAGGPDSGPGLEERARRARLAALAIMRRCVPPAYHRIAEGQIKRLMASDRDASEIGRAVVEILLMPGEVG